MSIKTFSAGSVLTASDCNTYLANSGLVYITENSVTSGASLSVNNCFSSTYDHYRLLITNFNPATAANSLKLRLRTGGTDAQGSDYFWAFRGLYVDGSSADYYGSNQSSIDVGMYSSANSLSFNYSVLDIFNPYKAERTFMSITTSFYNSVFAMRNGMGEHNLTTSYDGFTLFPSSGNILTLKYALYGYRKA